MTEAVSYVATRPIPIELRDPSDATKPLLDEDTGQPVCEVREEGDPVPEALHLPNFRALERVGFLIPAELWEDGRGRVRYLRARHRRGRERKRYVQVPPPPTPAEVMEATSPEPLPVEAEAAESEAVEPAAVEAEAAETDPTPEPATPDPEPVEEAPKTRKRPRKRTAPKNE